MSVQQYQFTANRLDNGSAVTGNLCQIADGAFIIPFDQYIAEQIPRFVEVDHNTVRRVIDLGETQQRSTEELQAESTRLRNEGNYILGKQKILADIISQRLRDAAAATRPWKVGDTVEVLTWQGRKSQWVEGICTDERTPGGLNYIAAKTKSGAAHKTTRLRPYSCSPGAQYRFEGKCYTFDISITNAPHQYKEVQP
jgi:hypothetical protein